jgi:sugar lactone lactonase YvrE
MRAWDAGGRTRGVLVALTLAALALWLALPAGAAGGDGTADFVVGQPNFTTGYPTQCSVPPTASTLCQPMQAVVDAAGNVWVADYGNSRVLMFPPGSTTATRVFGTKGSFTKGEPPPQNYPGPGDSCNLQRGSGRALADTLCQPEGLAIDSAGTLYVADTYNNRVLVFFNAASRTGDVSADLVLGQPGMTNSGANDINGGGTAPYHCPGTTDYGATECTLNEPESVSLDASGDLIVADTFNSRVLEWSQATLAHFSTGCTSSCHIPATHAWGQYGSFAMTDPNNTNRPDAYTADCPRPAPASACTMDLPSDAIVTGGHLIVADYANNRLLDFPSALANPTKQNATAVYGQANPSTVRSDRGSITPTATALWNPERLAADGSGRLWVADALNSRVLQFPAPGGAGATTATRVLGQGGSLTANKLNNAGVSAQSLAVPAGVSVDGSGNVWVADSDNSRVVEYSGAFPAARPTARDRASAQATPDSGRPLLMLRPSDLTALQAKVAANDPSWTSLKSDADSLVPETVFPYIYNDRTDEYDRTIFYDYQGEGWISATLNLGLASLMQPSNTAYSNRLIDIADEMLASQIRPQNIFPSGGTAMEPDSYYPSRNIGPSVSVIYSWLYDKLGATRRGRMVTLMRQWFTDMAKNGYEVNDRADGNYMLGHALAAAYMGYATLGDNPQAQEMIDYARIRIDGTPSALLPPLFLPRNYLSQAFDGGYTSYAAENAIATGQSTAGLLGAPFKGGFDFQGWSYGSGTFERLIDYMVLVRAAGGPDLITQHGAWLSAILHGLKAAMLPNNFEVDITGEWGGAYGGVVNPSLTVRLAYALAGQPEGPHAEHFNYSEVDRQSPFSDVPDVAAEPWEEFFYGDPNRPSTPLPTPLFYSSFTTPYPAGANLPATHGPPYFLMRSNASASATWASFSGGTAYYDDHQHFDAGTMFIQRGNDPLLVDATDWKCDGPSFCTEGIAGSSSELNEGAQANTLWFDDFSDAQCDGEQYFGGQNAYGKDQLVAVDGNASRTYVRTDLTSAYWSANPDGCGGRLADQSELDHYYRTFLFLPSSSLFVVLDQLTAKSSTSPHGPYLKHLRWHFPQPPTVSGSSVHVVNGSSGLWMDAVLPASPTLSVVNEATNPDGCDNSFSPCLPCDGTADGLTSNCTPWGDATAYTERVEERYPGNPLSQTFLSVFQAGAASSTNPTVTHLDSNDNAMTGAEIVQAGGATTFVLFNAGSGQTPTPVTSTSFTGSASSATYLLAGLTPKAIYKVSRSGSTITVTQDASGTLTASAAGVLQFTF